MAESDFEKRREALRRLRALRGATGGAGDPQASGKGEQGNSAAGDVPGGLRAGRGGLRAQLGSRDGNTQGAGLGGGLRGRLGQGAAAAGGQQGRPLLRQLLAKRLGQGAAPGAGAAGEVPAAGTADPETTRNFLRERIKTLQARLDELEKGGVEDATVIEATAGAGTSSDKD